MLSTSRASLCLHNSDNTWHTPTLWDAGQQKGPVTSARLSSRRQSTAGCTVTSTSQAQHACLAASCYSRYSRRCCYCCSQADGLLNPWEGIQEHQRHHSMGCNAAGNRQTEREARPAKRATRHTQHQQPTACGTAQNTQKNTHRRSGQFAPQARQLRVVVVVGRWSGRRQQPREG